MDCLKGRKRPTELSQPARLGVKIASLVGQMQPKRNGSPFKQDLLEAISTNAIAH